MDYNNYFKPSKGTGPVRNQKKIPYKGAAAHTPKSSQGIGDYYGTGIVAKLGRIRQNFVVHEQYAKDLKKPPRSLA
jgi:hypothetical protein